MNHQRQYELALKKAEAMHDEAGLKRDTEGAQLALELDYLSDPQHSDPQHGALLS